MATQFSNPAAWGRTRAKAISGFAITEFTQPPHRRLPWHVHSDASICFVLSGSYTERIGGTENECPPHSIVFKPPFERHTDQFGPFGGTCLLIEITPARLEAIEASSSFTTRPGLSRNPKLAAIGHRIYSEFTSGDAFSPLVVEGLILEILGQAARAEGEPPSAQRPTWLCRALEFIHDGYTGPLTLSLVAREVGVHPAHLARTFRQHQRLSIGEYVRRLRIERASQELASSSASISEIGLRAGFFDQSHFSRVFREHTGTTPAQFRAACRRCNAGTGPHSPS